MFLFIVFAALFLPSGTVPGSSELLSKWIGWVNKIAQQSHLALFSSASSPPWDGEGLYFQLFAGCSGSDFIPAWGPCPSSFSFSRLASHCLPPHTDDLLILCVACVFLSCDGALLRMPLASPYFPTSSPTSSDSIRASCHPLQQMLPLHQ